MDNGVELARLIILFEVVRACATFCFGLHAFLSVAGGDFCWARAVNCLSRFGLTQLFVEVKLQGPPVGLSQFYVRAVVAGIFFDRARQVVCVCSALGSRVFFWSWAFGVFFWVPARCFLFERWRQVKCFV